MSLNSSDDGAYDEEAPTPNDGLKETAPNRGKNNRRRHGSKPLTPSRALHSLQRLVTSSSSRTLSDEEIDDINLRSLARMLSLLREYESRFGMPQGGSPMLQQWVLEKLCSRLYAAGTPIWVLQPAMAKAAEGLTGAEGVRFLLLPRQALIFAPSSGATTMIDMERGFRMYMVTLMERVLVRLASFATDSKTRTVKKKSVQEEQFSRLLEKLQREPPPCGDFIETGEQLEDRENLSKQILNLASQGMGLFYLTHLEENASGYEKRNDDQQINSFWKVEPSIRELFTRLAAMEAEESINAVDDAPAASAAYYPRYVIIGLRILSSAGATGLWFSGSWQDMIVAGFLAIIVALFQGSSLWKHERMIFEVVVSFVVGLVAGLISFEWPEQTCFGAIAVGSVVDILQGFRIVYSIMELMSKHTLAGTADFVEAFLFTGLIAVFLKIGLFTASSIKGKQDSLAEELSGCTNPIDEMWYFLILPITSLAWAGLFLPRYSDLPVMALHGVLGYSVYYWVGQATDQDELSAFAGALSVTFSAGVVSRFGGRQALGDTVTGLYVLVPGAYLARELFAATESKTVDVGLLYTIVVNSVMIGLGAWTGTILCSPTILGTSKHRRFMKSSTRSIRRVSVRQESSAPEEGGAMLFF